MSYAPKWEQQYGETERVRKHVEQERHFNSMKQA
jgi:hypothetical protein